MTTTSMQNRRSILKTGLGLGASAGLSAALPNFGALAAQNNSGGGYKALVCIMLHGGMDGHDTLIPTTPGAYGQYASARQSLLADHARFGDDSREREQLLAITNGGQNSGFGMPRQFAPLAAMHKTGALSLVANVGVLEEYTDRSAVMDGTARIPKRLGSHNDQRSMWTSGELEAVSQGRGWGGAMAHRIAPESSVFSAISFGNEATFASSEKRAAYRLHFRNVKRAAGAFTNRYPARVRELMQEHYRASAAPMNNMLATDFQNTQREAFDASAALYDAIGQSDQGEAVRLQGNSLSNQLAMVAKMIAARGELGVQRQVFVVDHNGFDTHVSQAQRLPELQAQLADAMAAFYQETLRQGVADDVLTFTAAEFGRTLTPNANGTDHGWGNHHLVMGGSIRGGIVHGDIPEVGLEHDLDWGRGRTIPTTSVEQLAGGVGKWFGVPDDALAEILPRRGRFGAALAL